MERPQRMERMARLITLERSIDDHLRWMVCRWRELCVRLLESPDEPPQVAIVDIDEATGFGIWVHVFTSGGEGHATYGVEKATEEINPEIGWPLVRHDRRYRELRTLRVRLVVELVDHIVLLGNEPTRLPLLHHYGTWYRVKVGRTSTAFPSMNSSPVLEKVEGIDLPLDPGEVGRRMARSGTAMLDALREAERCDEWGCVLRDDGHRPCVREDGTRFWGDGDGPRGEETGLDGAVASWEEIALRTMGEPDEG
jgi:hypothetical protein